MKSLQLGLLKWSCELVGKASWQMREPGKCSSPSGSEMRRLTSLAGTSLSFSLEPFPCSSPLQTLQCITHSRVDDSLLTAGMLARKFCVSRAALASKSAQLVLEVVHLPGKGHMSVMQMMA